MSNMTYDDEIMAPSFDEGKTDIDKIENTKFPQKVAVMSQLYQVDNRNILGEGSFSIVYNGYMKNSTLADTTTNASTTSSTSSSSTVPISQTTPLQEVAIKCTPKADLTEADYKALTMEVTILQDLQDNQHIINLYGFYDEVTSPCAYQVLEKIYGGELFDRVVQQEYLNEKDVWDIAKILFDALGYIHDKGIAHRDLKPDNLLLVCKEKNLIKLADFGFAKPCEDNFLTGRGNLTTMCGTPTYVAPDILSRKPYGTKVDMWSAGVIIYILLAGYPPFVESNQRELFKKVLKCDFDFHDEYWNGVSQDAKDLILGLLVVDPQQRLTAKQALQTKWIQDGDGDAEMLIDRDLTTPNLVKLRKFNAIRKVRAAVQSVVAVHKFNSLLCGDLRLK